MDLASLNIEVKSTGVAPAARALDSLIKVASSGDAVIRNIASSLNYLRTQDFTGFAKNVQNLNNALKGTTGGFKEFVTSASSLNKVSNSFTAIATATDKLSGNSAGLSAIADQLDRIKSSLVEMKGSASVISRLGAGNTTVRSGSSGGSVSRPEDTTRLSQAQNRILSQLEREAFLVNHTKAEWLEYRAAQAGVASQAQSYVNTLKNTTQATNQLGMSQKQYNASLRGVPAQFTDIVVSLQGGQAPLTVLLQQGGQLKDMFGGIGNAVKVLGGYLLGLLLNPVVLVAAAAVTLGYAFYKGRQEMQDFAKATALTNGYIGVSKGQFTDLSREVAGSTGNISGAAEALTALAASGKVTNQNIGMLAKGVMDFSKATGKSISESAKAFTELADRPASAIRELDKQYHFLTASVYKQIIALEKQGRVQEAAALAQSELAKAAKNMNENVTENLGSLERFGRGAISIFTDLKNTLLSIGREQSTQQKIWDINLKKNEQFAEIEKERADVARRNQGASAAMQAKNNAYFQEQVDARKKLIAGYDAELSGINSKADAEAKAAADRSAALQKEEDLKRKIEMDSKNSPKDNTDKLTSLQSQLEGLKAQGETLDQQREKYLGISEYTEKINSHAKKARELDVLAANEKDAKVKSLYLELAAEQRLLLTKQQQTEAAKEQSEWQAESATEREKERQLARDIKAEQTGEVAILEEKSRKRQEDIQYLISIGQLSQKALDYEKASLQMKKDAVIAQLSGDPMKAVEAQYQADLLRVEQNLTLETGLLAAKDALNTQYEAKRIAAFQQQLSQQGLLSKMMVDGINAVTGAMSTQIAGMLKGTVSANDAMNALGDTILNSVVKSIVDWGVKKLWLMGVEQMVGTAQTAQLATQTAAALTAGSTLAAASVLEAAAVTAAWTPAAIAASIATFGGASITGGAAYAAALATGVAASKAASLPMMDNGGRVPLSGSAIIGEYRPELVQQTGSGLKVTSGRDTAKLLNGNNTPNVTINNYASADVSQEVDSEGNLIITLQKILPGMIASQAGNPKSSMNKALGSVFQMQRS